MAANAASSVGSARPYPVIGCACTPPWPDLVVHTDTENITVEPADTPGGLACLYQARCTHCSGVDGTPVSDQIVATRDWRGAPAAAKALRLTELAMGAAAGADLAGLGAGAHGCDSEAQCQELTDALPPLVATPCVVVNDARLLGPAAGRENAVGVIVGAGSIAVGVLPDGGSVYAGGWG